MRDKYYNYLRYIWEHRKNIKKACDFWEKEWTQNVFRSSFKKESKRELKRLLRKIILTHDLSKFSFKEFIHYRNWFYGEYGIRFQNTHSKAECKNSAEHLKCKELFKKACLYHYKRNKHHWNHWCYDWEIYEWNASVSSIEAYKLKEPMDIPVCFIREMIIDWTAMGYKFNNTPQEYYLSNYNILELSRETRFTLEAQLGLLSSYNSPITYCNEEYWMTIKELKEANVNLNNLLKPACERYGLDFDKYII